MPSWRTFPCIKAEQICEVRSAASSSIADLHAASWSAALALFRSPPPCQALVELVAWYGRKPATLFASARALHGAAAPPGHASSRFQQHFFLPIFSIHLRATKPIMGLAPARYGTCRNFSHGKARISAGDALSGKTR